MDGCFSDLVWASRGPTAGSVLATVELRVLLLEAVDAMVAASLYCTTIETVCTVNRIVQVHAASVNLFAGETVQLRLTFSDKKNVVCGST